MGIIPPDPSVPGAMSPTDIARLKTIIPEHQIVKKEEPTMSHFDESLTPTIAIYGLGGAGINLTNHIYKRLPDATRNGLSFRLLDTGKGNADGAVVPVTIVAGGYGSGGNRSELRDAVRGAMATMDLVDADVAVVIFSLSGGSGNVLATYLIAEYARRGKRVVAICIADTHLQHHSKNTLNSIKTLMAFAKNNDIYLPVMMFSNDKVSRWNINDAISNRTIGLINLLTVPTIEVDRNDRLNWLDPRKVLGDNIQSGLRSIHVMGGLETGREDPLETGEVFIRKPETIYDSSLVLGVASNASAPQVVGDYRPRARYGKEGIAKDVLLTPMSGVITVDAAAFDHLAESLEAATAFFGSQSTKQTVSKLFSASTDGEDDGFHG